MAPRGVRAQALSSLSVSQRIRRTFENGAAGRGKCGIRGPGDRSRPCPPRKPPGTRAFSVPSTGLRFFAIFRPKVRNPTPESAPCCCSSGEEPLNGRLCAGPAVRQLRFGLAGGTLDDRCRRGRGGARPGPAPTPRDLSVAVVVAGEWLRPTSTCRQPSISLVIRPARATTRRRRMMNRCSLPPPLAPTYAQPPRSAR